MQKILRVSAALFALVAVLYSGFWFYQSKRIKSAVELSLSDIANKMGGDKSEFTYSDSAVRGFPFGYEVQIDEPKLHIDDSKISADMYSKKPILFKSNLIGTKVSVILPDEIIVDSKGGGLSYANSVYKYSSEPVISIVSRYDSSNIFGSADDIGRVMVVKSVNYTDNGYSVYVGDVDEPVASADGTVFDYNVAEDGAYDILFDLKNARVDNMLPLGDAANLGVLNISADFTYNKEERNTNVRKMDISSDIFAVNAVGEFKSVDESPFPLGNMQIKLTKYENYVDYNVAIINYVVGNSAFPIFTLKEKQSDAVKEFIKTISTEKYNEDEDVLITIKHKDGEGMRIGEYDFYQALQLFRKALR